MKQKPNTNIALLVMLNGPLAWYIGFRVNERIPLINYRDLPIMDWIWPWLTAAIVLYAVGIYVTALLVQLMQLIARRTATVEPALLTLGSTAGLLAGVLSILSLLWLSPNLMQLVYGGFGVRPVLLILAAIVSVGALSFGGMYLAYRLQLPHSHPRAQFSSVMLNSIVPVSLIAMLIWMHFGSFPMLATAQTRQEWAADKFNYYREIVQSVSSCSPIQERIGSVKSVAPTFGRNYVVADEGSSGHRGALTLEVVGTQGAGIIRFEFRHATNISPGQFTYQNQSEIVECPRLGYAVSR